MSVARRTAGVIGLVLALQAGGGAQPRTPGVQEAAWAPDGRRVAVSYLDRIWTMAPDGRQPRALSAADSGSVEREPAWSPDGTRLAYAASKDDSFDIIVASVKTGASSVVAAMAGDERWPSWTPDGRLVFAHRAAPPTGRAADASRQWDLYMALPVAGSETWQTPVPLTDTPDSETFPRVSPDGTRVAFISERDAEDDVDIWWMTVPQANANKPVPLGVRPAAAGEGIPASKPSTDTKPPRVTRAVRARGTEAYLSWAPDNDRLAFYAVREGIGSVWVTTVEPARPEGADAPEPRAKPAAPPQLISRRGGAPAWSPDGSTILVTGLPDPQPVYNGNPQRSELEAPPIFALNAAFQMWRVAAPLPVHDRGGDIAMELPLAPAQLTATFDRVWDTLRTLYYANGPSLASWTRARDSYRPRAAAAKSEGAFETIVDEMVAQQPLIKPVVSS